MPGIVLRLDLFPLVISEAPEAIDEDDLAAFLEKFMVEVIGRRERYVHVVDAMRLRVAPSARARQMFAAWRRRGLTKGFERFPLGFAVATPSTLVRGAMTAIDWIAPAPVPNTWEPTLERALAWSVRRFEDAGVPIRLAVHEYLAAQKRS